MYWGDGLRDNSDTTNGPPYRDISWVVVERQSGVRQLYPYEAVNESTGEVGRYRWRLEKAIERGDVKVIGIFDKKSLAEIYWKGNEAEYEEGLERDAGRKAEADEKYSLYKKVLSRLANQTGAHEGVLRYIAWLETKGIDTGKLVFKNPLKEKDFMASYRRYSPEGYFRYLIDEDFINWVRQQRRVISSSKWEIGWSALSMFGEKDGLNKWGDKYEKQWANIDLCRGQLLEIMMAVEEFEISFGEALEAGFGEDEDV